MKEYESKLDKHGYKLNNIMALIENMMHQNKNPNDFPDNID